MHRKFYIENELKQRLNLQDLKSGALLTLPVGLGIAMERTYEMTGQAGRIVSEKFPVRTFTAIIVFDNYNAYSGYKELVDFIENAKSLKLIYAPRYEKTAQNEYVADIEIESIGKSEVRGGRMECDALITLKSAWYKRSMMRVVAERNENELRYEFIYDVVYNDVSTNDIEVVNDGHFEAPIQVEAEGELVNPKLELYVDGEKHAEMILTEVISAGETLLFSTKDDELYIKKVDSIGSETNLFDSLDIYNDNFFKLPKGTSTLKLSADNEIASKTIITVLPSYKAV